MPPDLTVLVLAAGGGSRLGGGKLLLPWRGKPIIRHVVDTALTLTPEVAVVVGHDAERVRGALPESVSIIENPDWRQGQSASLRRGIEAVPQDRPVMVMLGDQPRVKPETLAGLAKAHSADAPATAPEYAGNRGNPVILGPELFAPVLALTGDQGARSILARLGDRLRLVPVDDAGVLWDVDSPDDYQELTDS